jgi:hypothetical protein
VDFLLGAMLAMRAFRPLPDTPWRAPQPAHLRFAAAATFWAGVPLLVGAWIVDHLAAPLLRRAGWSNTYRVVAKKVGS